MPGPTELFVDFRTPVPGAEKALEAHMQAHRAYHARLRDEGKLLMCGPLLDGSGALVVLSVGSLQEAEAVTGNDPLVRHGVYKSRVMAWSVRTSREGLL
ncbi:MAG: hypothetical protein HYY01_15595 [Chloroflexi bacterium]|nr:hypothetical protein [Chloroflexota bacterium]